MNLKDFYNQYYGDPFQVVLITEYAISGELKGFKTTLGSFYENNNEKSMEYWSVKRFYLEDGRVTVVVQ